MNITNEIPIDHEVRIRILEDIAAKQDSKFERLESKMDSHFKWTLGMIVTLMIMMLTFSVTTYLKT